MFKRAAVALMVAMVAAATVAVATQAERSLLGGDEDTQVDSLFRDTTRSSEWRLVERVKLGFDAHHPEGLARVRDRFFLSTVEVTEPTVRCPTLATVPTARRGAGAAG